MSITEAVDQVIQQRRSIYTNMFSGEAVDDAIVEKMIENANWAPTHKLTEPWRFVVFKDDGLQQLGNFQAELYQQVAEKEGNFNEEKYMKFKHKPLECSHVIAIGLRRNDVVPAVEEVCAVACAVQNMWLTAFCPQSRVLLEHRWRHILRRGQILFWVGSRRPVARVSLYRPT